MATTTEKYFILQNEQGMFFQGLASRAPKKTAEVKTTDGQPAPEPDYEAASKLAREKKASIAGLAGLAEFFAGLDLSK